MQVPYLRLILGFLGIADVQVVCVDQQGPNFPDRDDVAAAARSELLALVAEPARA